MYVEQEPSAVCERDVARGVRRAARSAACARIHGLRSTPRPTSTPSTPSAHAADDLLRLDAVAAAEDRDRQLLGDRGDEVPVAARCRLCAAVRPWTATAAAPASSTICASVGAFALASFHPARILTVTGILTAFAIAPIDRRGVRGLAHQAAAGVVLRDLRHRAAHVDVDDVGADAFDDLRGFRHLRGVAAEDLNRNRPFFFGVFGVLERPIDAAHQPFGAAPSR